MTGLKSNINPNRIFLPAVVTATIILAFIFLFPYIYLILTSLKPSIEAITSPPTLIPSKISFENYLKMSEYLPIGKYFLNSITASLGSTLISIFLGSMAAYGVSRYSSNISNGFLIFTLAIRMIPLISISIPVYSMIKNLGLIDTKLALILVYTSINIPFVIWMMSGFFDGIPKELDESARVDGCRRLSVFIRIILPISLPGLATTAIFAFMLSWNDFLFALLLTSTSSKTATVGISEFLTAYNLDLGPMTSAAVLFSFPIMLFSFLIQKYIVSGMTLGAVKG